MRLNDEKNGGSIVVGYAVVGYFDRKSDDKIRSLWKGMADSGVCDYLIQSANNPHIKFAMYNDLYIETAEKNLSFLANQVNKINVHFKTYSFYPNEKPFICIDIAVSIPILDIQTKICKSLCNDAVNDERSFFEQGIWKPDCQLTQPFNKSKLTNAINYLSQNDLPFNGVLERIGMIEFHPARQLFSYELG